MQFIGGDSLEVQDKIVLLEQTDIPNNIIFTIFRVNFEKEKYFHSLKICHCLKFRIIDITNIFGILLSISLFTKNFSSQAKIIQLQSYINNRCISIIHYRKHNQFRWLFIWSTWDTILSPSSIGYKCDAVLLWYLRWVSNEVIGNYEWRLWRRWWLWGRSGWLARLRYVDQLRIHWV